MAKRSLITALLLCAISLMVSSTADAQTTGAYPRLKLLEEFTSTTCGPCVSANQAVDPLIDVAKGVVSVRYHTAAPILGDPWYAENPTDLGIRSQTYGANGAPFCIVGGNQGVDVVSGGVASVRARVVSALNSIPPTSFVRVLVTQNGPKIVVKVKSDRALSNSVLQLVCLTRFIRWNDVPGTNGEKEFYDVMHKMYPDARGTALNQAANEERTYEFTPSLGTGKTWAGKQYFLGFVQDMTNGEILQTGITQTSTTPPDYSYPTASAVTSASVGSKYLRVDRGGQSSSDFVVTNSSSAPVTVSFNVDNSAALAEKGMSVSISPETIVLPASGTATVKTTVTGPNRSELLTVNRSYSASDGLGRGLAPVTYLVNGAKAVLYSGVGSYGGIATQVTVERIPAYDGDVVSMPYSSEIVAAYPTTSFNAAIFAFDQAWTDLRGEKLETIKAMTAAKKGVWVTTQSGMQAAYQQYPTDASFDATRQWYRDVLGVSFVRGEQRVTISGGQITGVVSFPVKGVANDPIGKGIDFVANRYVSGAWTLFAIFNDIMAKTSGSKAVPVLYSDNSQSNIGLVRVEPTNGGRIVYGSIGTEMIYDTPQRNLLTERVLDWLLEGSVLLPKIAVSTSTMNYGNVEVDGMKDMSFDVTNTGDAELSITALNITGADAASFYVSAGGPVGINPIKIAVGAKRTIQVTFAPTVAKSIFGAVLNFASNANTPPSVQLRGSSSVTSVETDVVSETGAIGMKLVGSNPVTDNSSIRVSGNGNISVTVVDAAGRTVSTLFDGSINGTESVSIASSTLATGTYSIVASNGSDRAVLTVVVVR